MIVEVSNELKVSNLTFDEKRELKESLSFINPKWTEAVQFGRRTYGIQKIIRQYRCEGSTLIIPRGCLHSLIEKFGPPEKLIDNRISFDKIDIPSKIELRSLQKPWVENALKYNQGICVAAAGMGKTVCSLEMISRLGQPILWLVDQTDLAEQFMEKAEEFVDIGQVGLIGDGEESLGKVATTGLIQTLHKRDLSDIVNLFGAVFVDECHTVPATTVTKVVSQFPSKRLYGLTATPYREDNLEILMYNAIGPTITYVDRDELVETGLILPASIKVCNTGVTYNKWGKPEYRDVIDYLSTHEARNSMIVLDILSEIAVGNVCIALTLTIDHGKLLRQRLLGVGVDCEHIHSKQYKKTRKEKLKRFKSGEIPLMIATHKLLGKGFDHPPANRLFYTLPQKAENATEQSKGRIERVTEGKVDAVVYDYLDDIEMLKRQFEIRILKYNEHNLKISYRNSPT